MNSPQPSVLVKDLGAISFNKALSVQKDLMNLTQSGQPNGVLIVCEHFDCYTAGIDSQSKDCLEPGVTPIPVDRGGGITYHGQGQIVCYPIMLLEPFDVTAYIRKLEKVIIDFLSLLGVEGGRRKRLTGVWTKNGKIGFIGIKTRANYAMHGFSVNISCDLDRFRVINPCGLKNLKVASVLSETGAKYDYKRVAGLVAGTFCEVFGYSETKESIEKNEKAGVA